MSAKVAASTPPVRLASIDAYRGLVMFLMLGEVLQLCSVSAALPNSGFWAFLCHHPFEDTLSQIGLGYVFLFLIGLRPVKVQWIAFGVVVFGYWLAFALYPLPGPDFDWSRAGVAADWNHHAGGFAAHWNQNSNLAWAFDTWFLNLFPREKEFLYNGGGYSTLSFIPTLATMLLGLFAGGWLKSDLKPGRRSCGSRSPEPSASASGSC